jgi:hypothetical protein
MEISPLTQTQNFLKFLYLVFPEESQDDVKGIINGQFLLNFNSDDLPYISILTFLNIRLKQSFPNNRLIDCEFLTTNNIKTSIMIAQQSIVGMCNSNFFEDECNNEHFTYMYNFNIFQEFREKGYGKEMFKEFLISQKKHDIFL